MTRPLNPLLDVDSRQRVDHAPQFHCAGVGQLAITALLALLLALALLVKTFAGTPASDDGSLRLEGQIRNKVTIEK